MARPCMACEHPDLLEINRAIVDSVHEKSQSKRFRIVGSRFGLDWQILKRHAANHLTDGLKRAVAKHAEIIEETRDLDVMASLGRAAQKLERFLDAADAWLRDPNDPTRYSLGPREHEVIVIWEREIDIGDGVSFTTERKKEPLTDILRRCGEKSDMAPKLSEIRTVEVKHGDPRKLLLDAMTAGKPLLELLGKATGQIRPDPGITLNVFLESKEWQQIESTLVESLRPYPPALDAAGRALATIGGEDGQG